MLSYFFRRLIPISFLGIVSCSVSLTDVDVASLGEVQDLHTGERFSPQVFFQKIVNVPHILLGEQHDNLKHHQAQFWLLQQLQKHRHQGSLLLEMLSVDQQPQIVKISQNSTAHLTDLPAALNWKASWDWRFYGEIVRYGLENQIALVATNLTEREIAILMQGAEPLQGDKSTRLEIQQKIAQLISQNHLNDINLQSSLIQKMVQVQQFRDRRMAEKLLKAKIPSLLIAGNHHVNKQIGIVQHLQDLSPQTKVITILMGSNPSYFSANDADYFWILN